MSIVFCLIVKNEVKNIEKCILNSCVKENIKHILIVDTGSTDGTQDLIKNLFTKYKLDGKLIEHSFKTCKCHPKQFYTDTFFHFGENRSYALDQAYIFYKKKCKYIFMTDADDTLIRSDNDATKPVGLVNFVKKNPNKLFCIHFSRKGCDYYRPLIFPNNNEYRFSGGLHEYLTTKKGQRLDEFHILNVYDEKEVEIEMISGKQDNERNSDPEKYKKDATFLEMLIGDKTVQNKENFWRYCFYCAQSWFDYANANPSPTNYNKAHEWLDFVIENKDKCWKEEVYNAYKKKVKIAIENKINTNIDYNLYIKLCDDSINYHPERIEMYYYKYACMMKNKIDIYECIESLKIGLQKAIDSDKFLFYEKNLFEVSQNIIKCVKKKRTSKVILIFSSIESELLFNKTFKDSLENNYNTLSLSSFSGIFKNSIILSDEDKIANIIFNISKEEKYTFICVNTLIDRTKINLLKDDFKLYFYSQKEDVIYNGNEFDIKVTDKNYLYKKLLELNFDGIVKYNENIKEEVYENIPEYDNTTYNINWYHQRDINHFKLERGFELIPKEFFKDKEIKTYTNKEIKKYFRNFVTLNHDENLLKTNSIIELFFKAKKIFIDLINKKDLRTLKEVYDQISQKFYYIDHHKEHIDNIIACRYIKDIPVKTFIENKRELNNLFRDYIDSVKKELIKIKDLKINDKKILLTMTTCKRFDYFKDTFDSILLNFPLNELLMISSFYIVDDGSSYEDINKMKEEFPFCDFQFNPSSGHANSMNCIYNKAILENFDYIIGLEDDFYFFEKRNYVTDSLNILMNDESISQIVFNRCNQETDLFDNRRKPLSTYNPTLKTLYSKDINGDVKAINYFNHKCFISMYERERNFEMNLFKNYNHDTFQDGINTVSHIAFWKGFTFMPSMYSVEKVFKKIGGYTTEGFFEGTFSEEVFWSNYPKENSTAYFDTFSVNHCGRLSGEKSDTIKNAYELNNKDQYGDKEDKTKEFLILASITQNLKEVKEQYKNTSYRIIFIDNFGSISNIPTECDTIEKIIEFKRKIYNDEINKYKNVIEYYKEDTNRYDWSDKKDLKFYFRKDVYGYDIDKFENLSLSEMKEKTKELGGNAFNSLGYIKKIENFDKNMLKDIVVCRTPLEGLYVI